MGIIGLAWCRKHLDNNTIAFFCLEMVNEYIRKQKKISLQNIFHVNLDNILDARPSGSQLWTQSLPLIDKRKEHDKWT